MLFYTELQRELCAYLPYLRYYDQEIADKSIIRNWYNSVRVFEYKRENITDIEISSYVSGVLHNEDGPAYCLFCDEHPMRIVYKINGMPHREDGPAVLEYGLYSKILKKTEWCNNGIQTQMPETLWHVIEKYDISFTFGCFGRDPSPPDPTCILSRKQIIEYANSVTAETTAEWDVPAQKETWNLDWR